MAKNRGGRFASRAGRQAELTGLRVRAADIGPAMLREIYEISEFKRQGYTFEQVQESAAMTAALKGFGAARMARRGIGSAQRRD